MDSANALSKTAFFVLGGCVVAALGWMRAPWPASQGGTQDGGAATGTQSTPFAPAIGNADSNNRMIAVTGIDITGSSILYLVDTVDRHLAVYQATGGTNSMQGLRLVGARRIDLDLQLDGLNDKSEYTYKKLRQLFVDQGLLTGSSASGAEVPAGPAPKGD